jgi:sulfotransferase family protein
VTFAHRPDFFVIGAQRAGTTRLCHLLSRHPRVAIPSKEPFYFQSIDAMIEKRAWYRQLFERASGDVFGEGSTYYSMAGLYPGTAERLFGFNPEARIVYIARHPLRRIESAWYHLLSVGHVSSLHSFASAVRRTDLLIDPTLYWKQLSEYRAFFPDTQIQTILFEDFVAAETETVAACFEFLGVEPVGLDVTASSVEKNASEGMTRSWRALDAIRAAPAYGAVKRAVPQLVKTAATERLRRPVQPTAAWDAELHRYVRERLGDDPVRFLEHAGRSGDYWDLSAESALLP